MVQPLFSALSISSFEVQAHIHQQPGLYKKAFALVAQAGQKSVVLQLSPKASHMGLDRGANEWRASRRHPNIQFLAYDSDCVQKLWIQIVALVENLTPRCVVIKKGNLVLDLSGMQRLIPGGERGFATQIQELFEVFPRLNYRVVFAPTIGAAVLLARYYSSVGSPFFPNTLNFTLGELHELEKIPLSLVLGITSTAREKLKSYQLKNLGQIQKLPLRFLRDHFAKEGELLWLVAQGRSYGKVKDSGQKVIDTTHTRVSKVEVHREFEQDLQDLQVLEDVINDLIDELAFELRLQKYWTKHLAIEVFYADQKSHKENIPLPKMTNKFLDLCPLVKSNLPQILSRRVSVRSLKAIASRCVSSGGQEDLFEQSSSNSQIAIQEALDVIRNKHGFAKIGNPQSHV